MMLTAWRMSVRMDPDLDPQVMRALADTLLPLFDAETDCAVHFVGLRLAEDAVTDANALRAGFTPRAIGFAPLASRALQRLLTEIEHAESLEIRFFNLDTGRITIRLEGLDLAIAAENPRTLLMLTEAIAATEEEMDPDWHDEMPEDAAVAPSLSHDALPLRRTASG